MIKFLRRFVRDDSGVTAIEYGLIAALVAVVAVAGFTSIGTNLLSSLNTIAGKI